MYLLPRTNVKRKILLKNFYEDTSSTKVNIEEGELL